MPFWKKKPSGSDKDSIFVDIPFLSDKEKFPYISLGEMIGWEKLPVLFTGEPSRFNPIRSSFLDMIKCTGGNVVVVDGAFRRLEVVMIENVACIAGISVCSGNDKETGNKLVEEVFGRPGTCEPPPHSIFSRVPDDRHITDPRAMIRALENPAVKAGLALLEERMSEVKRVAQKERTAAPDIEGK